MARGRNPIYVEGSDGRPLAGATVQVKTDPGGVDAVFYAARTGGVTIANPQLTDARGRVAGYLDRGDYIATITAAGMGTWTEAFEAIPGADSGVDALWVPPDGITSREVDSTILAALGVNEVGSVRRGKSIIATPETRANAAYGLLATPDRVQGVVLPADGLIVVAYQATWQSSVADAGRAAIFLGANQVVGASGSGIGALGSFAEAVMSGGQAAMDTSLSTYHAGLRTSPTSGVNGPYTGDVTTGQVIASNGVGGICAIFAAAGTYDVSVQFKSASGSVTVKSRKLWVWALGF